METRGLEGFGSSKRTTEVVRRLEGFVSNSKTVVKK